MGKTNPLVIVTRKLPEPVEVRAERGFRRYRIRWKTLGPIRGITPIL